MEVEKNKGEVKVISYTEAKDSLNSLIQYLGGNPDNNYVVLKKIK